MLEPLGLLKQALASLVGPEGRQRRTTESLPPQSPAPDMVDIYERLEGFEARLSNGAQQLQTPKTNVPDNLHFVWLGGGLGDIQRDYINIWKQTLAGQGYTLKLWYDSDALLAHETNRIIVEAAKADAMLNGGQTTSDAFELADKYEERAIALKQQMFAHINKAVESGESADNARIDLLVRAYSQDEARLKVLREKNRQSLLSLGEGGIVLRDLATEATPLYLQDIYAREISLRGNFAAASDIVRVEALFADGGSYADVDNLPPLLETLGGVDISRFELDARLGVLQLILDHSPEWMPGRQVIRSKYKNYFERIPLEHREALERFAKSKPDLASVFRRPVERQVRPDGLRAVAERSSFSNAFLMAHPGSAMLKAVLDRFRLNYEVVDATARLAVERKIALIDVRAVADVANEVAEKRFGPLHELPNIEHMTVSFLVDAVAGYYSDGIRPQIEMTIYLTGPAAVRDGLADYEKMHFTPRGAEASRAEVLIPAIATVNRATEEEQDHSWKENESDTAQWLNREKLHWEAGKFKTRYAGDVAQLLKYQSISFDQGWPVIEGRHVLITDLLQQLADDLGEPFRKAMSEYYTGRVTFEKPLSLSFDDRQAIIAQAGKIIPTAPIPDAATQNLSVDELLSQIPKDRVLLTKLTPLQRLLLGGLLGVDALNNEHFAAGSATLENLANSMSDMGVIHRYGAIERELFKQSHPAFLAGLKGASNPSVALSETSVDLKKQALARPLTLLEWGRSVARIQHVAKLEYRDRVIERTGEVLGSFKDNTFKIAPQDLLLKGAGDRVAGRCYPLALAMAAALHKSNTAANTLRARFFLTVINSEDADSKAFVSMIEELRDAPVNDIGNPLMRSDLAQVVAILEEKTASTTLMLNSDNHSMLVAKIFEGERSNYLFYDPNLGTYEIGTSLAFRDALTDFFLRKEMAMHYAAFGDAQRPTFDLIELDGEKLNSRVLASGIEVSSLSESGALPEQTVPRVRQRLASARGRSLVNNAALGSSLLELDAHWWGGQIAQATRQLQEQHGLASDSVALFETLEITPTGGFEISVLNPVSEKTVRVTTSDHRFLRIKEFLSDTFHSLAARPRASVSPLDPTEAGSVHTLNAGFTVQALMNALRHHEGAASGSDKALTTAIRLHAYVNYAQLAHGNIVDVLGVVNLVRQALNDEKLIARTSAPLVQKALGHIANEGVGTVLGLVNVGFDIYQLSHATNDIERAQFGTQLAFDSVSAVV
ncbi:TcdA/TcdB catalytic glycosyltransferase domain-containing protein, partial [Pseudomonas sp. FW305-122]|uniref:TcdA/TcdB catalytic glycosyltransferase domain-containing protein n=9 Tax=Pseudomonas TaxID=286 RepID=UPI002870AC88